MAGYRTASSIIANTPCRTGLRLLGICVVIGSLAACAQQPKPMYNWQSYQPEVYEYLKGESSDYAKQTQALEENIETARSANQALPPGFHAHLGMLYLKQGDANKAMEQIQSEKLAFPESTPFMEFLLRNAGNVGTNAHHPTPASDSVKTEETTSTDITPPLAQKSKKGA